MRPYANTITQLKHYLATKKKIDENKRAYLVCILSGFTLTWPAVLTYLVRRHKAKDSATRAKQCALFIDFVRLHEEEKNQVNSVLTDKRINIIYKNLYRKLISIFKNTMNDGPTPPPLVNDPRILGTQQWKTEFLKEFIDQLTQSNSTQLKAIVLEFNAQPDNENSTRLQYQNPQGGGSI